MKEVIKISRLTKIYKTNKLIAVDNISFNVYENEFFAFLGVNGAGKSTTINILCTLLEKTKGDVEVCGFNIETDIDEIKDNIGVVFQNGLLDKELSIYDNLILRGSLFNIDKTELKEKIEFLSKKLSMGKFIDQNYGKLSGGQKRKSDIARALLTNPKILFLDEPTTGLDPQSRKELWNVINEIRKEFKTTIFLTTHYMEEVDAADRVAIIDNGKILCIDTPENLKSKYSNDIVKLTINVKNKEILSKKLDEEKVDYEYLVDTFIITLKESLSLIEFINKNKKYISSIEMKKGDMDSVFLNIVGRVFENE